MNNAHIQPSGFRVARVEIVPDSLDHVTGEQFDVSADELSVTFEDPGSKKLHRAQLGNIPCNVSHNLLLCVFFIDERFSDMTL